MATEYAAPFDASPIATSLQFRRRNRVFSLDGVVRQFNSTALVCTPSGGTAIDVADGRANLQGTLYDLSDGPKSLAVAANGGGSNRTDLVVLRYDATASPGIQTVILAGAGPGTGPAALTQDGAAVWEMPIFQYEKTPGGSIVNTIDRRWMLDGMGGLIIKDAAVVGGVPLPNYNTPIDGMRLTATPSAREWRYSSQYAFWERIDPQPLLELKSGDGGDVTSTSWTSSLSGAPILSGTFKAPLSGRIKIFMSALIGAGDPKVQIRCRISGPTLYEPLVDDVDNIIAETDEWATHATSFTLSELTPAGTYTAAMQYIKESGGGSNATFVDNRHLMIERA